MHYLKEILIELLVAFIVALLVQGLLTPPPPLTVSVPMVVIHLLH